MKRFVGYVIDKAVKAIPRKKKVSPDIKSVKKFTEKEADQFAGTKSKTPQERANVVRKRESIKRMNKLEGLQNKRKEGIKASKEVKKMVDTGKAKNVGGSIFHKNIREKKMGGGMMGRRIGRRFGGDTMKKKTNIEKIRETFSPKNKNLKPVDKKKQKGLAKLPIEVRNKMGYMKSGGRAGFKGGSDMSKKPATVEAIRKAEKRMKAASEVSKNQGRSFTNIQREKHMR